MRKQKKLSKWFYAAMIIFAVGGATGCLYSAAATALLSGYAAVVLRRRSLDSEPTVPVMTDRFAIAAQQWRDGSADGQTLEPTSIVMSAAA